MIISLAAAFVVAGCGYDWDSTWVALPDASVDTLGDAPLHDKAPHDETGPNETGPKPDGPISSWSVHIHTFAGANASCEVDEVAVGGGATCPAGKSISISAPQGSPKNDVTVKAWWGGCSNGNPTATYIVCVKGMVIGREPKVKVVGQTKSGAKTVEATCDSGDRLVGGGCLCESPNLVSSRPHGSDQTWLCVCDGGPLQGGHRAYALCAPAAAKGLQLQLMSLPGNVATCPKGKLALGGGCQAKVKYSKPGIASWTCANGMAHVICAAVKQH